MPQLNPRTRRSLRDAKSERVLANTKLNYELRITNYELFKYEVSPLSPHPLFPHLCRLCSPHLDGEEPHSVITASV
jgi:hypothetical protein